MCKETREEVLPYYELKPSQAKYERTIASRYGATIREDFSWGYFDGPLDSKDAKMFKPRYFSFDDTFIIDVEPASVTRIGRRMSLDQIGLDGFQLNAYNKHIFKDVNRVAVTKECWDKFGAWAEGGAYPAMSSLHGSP